MPAKKQSSIIEQWLENPFSSIVHTWSLTAFTAVMFLVVSALIMNNSTNINITKADTADTYVDIVSENIASNTLPQANNVIINDGDSAFNLMENNYTYINCRAIIIDSNNCSDIKGANFAFYRSGIEDKSTCNPNDANCYQGQCQLKTDCQSNSDTTVTVNCSIPVNYYAQSTDLGSNYEDENWICEIIPFDATGNGIAETDNIEINTLTAINVDNTINYGTVAKNNNTGKNNQLVKIANSGNQQVNLEISGTDMNCTHGTLPVNQQKYDFKNLPYDSLNNTLSPTITNHNISLTPGTNQEMSHTNLFWGIAIPAEGVSGSCKGSNSFTAIPDTTA